MFMRPNVTPMRGENLKKSTTKRVNPKKVWPMRHWDDLIHFMTDGRIEADNNLTEQEIKAIVGF